MIGRLRLAASAILFLCATCAGPAFAQTGGTLQGAVLDDQGLALPGATVTLTNTETGWSRALVTDADGRYRAPALPLTPPPPTPVTPGAVCASAVNVRPGTGSASSCSRLTVVPSVLLVVSMSGASPSR